MNDATDDDTADIYAPEFVAELFDRCSANYRRWSAVSSFGFIWLWRRQCVAAVPKPKDATQRCRERGDRRVSPRS